MSRLSIAILVLIVLGFIMTVKRDEPQYPGTPPTVGTAQTPKATDGAADKNKKAATPPKAGPTVAVLPPKAQPVTTPVVPNATPTPPAVPPALTPQAAANPPAAPPKVDDKTGAKPAGGLTEQTVSGNTPTSATPSIGLIEGGENLGRETQKELSRLGCFTGNITERWSKEGRAAVKRFNAASRYAWDDWPKPDLLASLKRYPDNYCKKCRSGGGGAECEDSGTEANKGTAPTVKMGTPPEKSPVTAALPPSTAVKPTPPPAATPPATTPVPPVEASKVAPGTPNLNITPPPPATANELKDQNGVKSAAATEGTPDENATPYLPPSSKPQGKEDDNDSADTGEGKKPKNARKRPVRDEEELVRRSTPRRSRPVAEESRPRPRMVYRPVERNYTPAPRRYVGSGGRWELRPQGVGR